MQQHAGERGCWPVIILISGDIGSREPVDWTVGWLDCLSVGVTIGLRRLVSCISWNMNFDINGLVEWSGGSFHAPVSDGNHLSSDKVKSPVPADHTNNQTQNQYSRLERRQ